MNHSTATPRIAAQVLLRKDNKLAFVLRSATGWMDGQHGLPGGRVEKDETFTGAAIREAKEEAGVDIKPADIKPVLTVHRKGNDATDWVDLYFEALMWSGEPFNAEPDKHSELVWLDPDNLPDNIIPEVRQALQLIKNGEHYAEYGWQAKL